MHILGISAFYHDSAAALIKDGDIVAAAQEERFTRKKHDPSFPSNSIKYCLKESGIKLRDIDFVAFYEKPFLKFDRLLETYVSFAPRGFKSFKIAMPVWIKDKLFQKSGLCKSLQSIDKDFKWESKLLFAEHHQSHAASAFFPSPFENAAVLTMDGVGEWATTSLGLGSGNSLNILKEIHFPHSLGLLYSAFTYYTGFRVNSGEYKVMGLAPYGEPVFADIIMDNLIDIKEDGTFRLNMSYFDYCTGVRMTNDKFDRLFGSPPRDPETLLTQREMNLAASVQKVTEEIIIRLGRSIARETGEKNLCLAGGVALNCVANGKLLRENCFENIWIQPAAGDAGGALGAAMVGYYCHEGKIREPTIIADHMKGAYLGPEFNDEEISQSLEAVGANFSYYNDDQIIEITSDALANGQSVGWFQGRMEFGPRALGCRSILADPSAQDMQKRLNLKIKYRESFRPFAPSILAEDLESWFKMETTDSSPYMQIVADIREEHRLQLENNDASLFGIDKLNVVRSKIPAVTHVDYSARIQTVHKETNPTFHALISAFKSKTGIPILVNTSFNVRGEPIVCNPEDAFRCFMGSEIEVLVCGNYYLEKEKQDKNLVNDYKDRFALD